jgi:tripartite-type tricarboxylate transporter receptor subunit TctC
VLPAVKASIPYRIPDSFEFVSSFASYPLIVGVNSQLPITDFKGLVAYAKANPGKLNYSSSGTGGGGHMLPAYMAKVLGIDMVHISYESGGTRRRGGRGRTYAAVARRALDGRAAHQIRRRATRRHHRPARAR